MRYYRILFCALFLNTAITAGLVKAAVIQETSDNSGLSSGAVILLIVTAILFLIGLFIIIRRLNNQGNKAANKNLSDAKDQNDPKREIMAAISYALYLYLEGEKDQEKTMLTIKQVQRTYSPWNSRVQMLRKWPR